MLSLALKTVFLPIATSWLIGFFIACGVRSRTQRGLLSIKHFLGVVWNTGWAYLCSSASASSSWYPIVILYGLSLALFREGLTTIASISLLAAMITQIWRYDFPCFPFLTATLGWDHSAIVANRKLILPFVRVVALSFSFWGLTLGLSLATLQISFVSLLIIGTFSCSIALSLRSALAEALKLELQV